METNYSPIFSVIIPTYNRPFLCARAVKSVVDQTETSWELQIVDDGSNDITRQLVDSFKDSRIHYKWQENAGAGSARNHGIRNANGKFICFLDSDDEFLPNHLEVLKGLIQIHGMTDGFYFSLGYIQDNFGRYPSPDYRSTPEIPIRIGESPDINGICISKSILDTYQFNEELKCHEDAELWGRIALRYPVFKIHERTYVTYFHGGPRITSNNLKHYLEMERVYTIIEETRDTRAKLSEAGLKHKWEEIYLGILRNGWQRERSFFWRYYFKMFRSVGPSIVFKGKINKAIMKHYLFRLGWYGRTINH